MKAKISPTSPKNKQPEDQIAEVYRNKLATIDQPQRQKNGSNIVLLVIVVLIGFMAGVISQLVLFSYGQNIPFLSKLGIFNGSTQIYTITGRSNNAQPETQLQKSIDTASQSVVGIYGASSVKGDLADVVVSGDSLGTGLILTDDGYVVTLKNTIGDRTELRVVTVNGTVLDVESAIPDPASDLVVLKTNGTSLSVVPLAAKEDVSTVDDVFTLSLDQPLGGAAAEKNSIAQTNFTPGTAIDDLVRSSDRYANSLVLSTARTDESTGVVFSLDGSAIGIEHVRDGLSLVTPFYFISGVVSKLSSGTIERPYLGLTYLDISNTLGLPDNLTQKLTSGALIYSHDEKGDPSIKSKSPAQKAGLQKGDVITAVDGQPISSVVQLNGLILSKKAGDTVTVDYNRIGTEKELKITLGTQ